MKKYIITILAISAFCTIHIEAKNKTQNIGAVNQAKLIKFEVPAIGDEISLDFNADGKAGTLTLKTAQGTGTDNILLQISSQPEGEVSKKVIDLTLPKRAIGKQVPLAIHNTGKAGISFRVKDKDSNEFIRLNYAFDIL